MCFRVSAIVVSFVLAALPAIAQDCTVYQHRDYAGSHWGINAGERLAGIRSPGLNQTCADANCHIYWQPDWNDQISSFQVRSGCTITLWEHIDGRSLPPRGGGAHFRSNRNYSYVGSSWNDKASLVECACR
jgi:hypothetical protein